MKEFLSHLFLPRESNNHRSKLLHHQNLFLTIVFFFVASILFSYVRNSFPTVLGAKIDISAQELLFLTNQKRLADGELPLTLSDQLSKAAQLKAQNMFEKNYWAHNSPDGTTPWVFVKDTGYEYVYAGENLARGFSSSSDVVNAWMASPSHKENMLSDRYQEVGFAIVPGKLVGENTILVVEMFGNKTNVLSRNEKKDIAVVTKQELVQEPALQGKNNQFVLPLFIAAKNQPLINSFSLVRSIGIFTLLLFITVFILDMVIVQKKNIVRLVGHNTDHIVFLTVILLLVIMINSGIIL